MVGISNTKHYYKYLIKNINYLIKNTVYMTVYIKSIAMIIYISVYQSNLNALRFRIISFVVKLLFFVVLMLLPLLVAQVLNRSDYKAR